MVPKTLEYADTSDNSWLISTNTYNSLGQITAHRDTHIDTTIVNDRRSYAYNTYGQLICEEFLNDNLVYTYTYDAAGNILSWEKIDTSTNTILYLGVYEYDGAWADVLTKYNYTEIAYTGVGLPTYIPSVISSADAKTLTWNSDGRLSRVRLGNRLYVDMTYDASGLRTSKTYGGVLHEYLYDDGRLITEKINGYSMVFLYDESNNVDCIWYKNAKYYLIRNTFGDVVQLRDANNAVVAYYKYNAFGYLLSVTDANGAEITDTSHIAHLNPIRYRGYYYDAELKMYYLYSRYYNPEMGRFISADVIVGTSLAGTNLFAYCGNDPVNYIDPYGYCYERYNCTCNNEDDKDGACNCRTACNFQICPPEERLQTLPDVDEPGSTNSQNSGAGSGGGTASNQSKSIINKTDTSLSAVKGYTKHGLEQAMGRDGVGVKPSAILDALRYPIEIISKIDNLGRISVQYIGRQSTVVLNALGNIVTCWAKGSEYWRK